ncbi:hypothetical protein M422DRAFT_228646 [Sphaerobolus stellatus SS14]|uniref:Methyltransferase domain-containing protein n=1 Tax=Sphaerobolus stellatus (strain SS14) TaxID=990650 RepID=A0A0C9VZN9_SPHS4|nr:hypothetical protein M422DRAFT_228646 [Sphaerobolus stellatus SS14]
MDLSRIVWNHVSPASSSKSLPSIQSELQDNDILTPALRKKFFKMIHGRRFGALAKYYPCPVDESEIERMSREHRMLAFVYGGKNYAGPVEQVLRKSPHKQRRILDVGTGSGVWACEMADEFDHAEVIGVDAAPIQPEEMPRNCSFEIYDVTKGPQMLPYDDDYFDLIHIRSVHTGITNYASLMREARRVLRPGGLIILAEIDTTPMTANKEPISLDAAPGWCEFWAEYRRCLSSRGIDPTIPTRLRQSLQQAHGFSHIVAQEAALPIGFHPQPNVTLVTIGQLAWLNYDTLLHSLVPFLYERSGRTYEEIDELVSAAQSDLYNPIVPLYTCLHIVHATKSLT